MAKGVLAKGTKVWVLHGTTTKVLTRMDCVKSFEWGDDSVESIDTTCLDDADTKTSEYGINDPGEGSMMIETDTQNASHLTLLGLAQDKAEVIIYVGWSDGDAVPTLSGSAVTLPESRTWDYATAQLRKSPSKFEQGAMVNHTITIKRQSEVVTEFKGV